MRRFFTLILCCLMLTTCVYAQSAVTEMESSTTVASNGTCKVTLTIRLDLEEDPGQIWFPLPKAARDITVNGRSVGTRMTTVSRDADLSDEIHAAGQQTLVIHYSLPDAVHRSAGQLYLKLDILSGFRYPIEAFSFTVELPGEPEKMPDFVSTYHQEDVEGLLDTRFSGNCILCSATQPLKDHESLSMTLMVSEDMFPQSVYKRWSISLDDMAMYACTALALLYWLVFLRARPRRSTLSPKGPEGINPGEYPCALMGAGVDMTAMVIAWAQMGYLHIRLDPRGRVLLHKRMDMGNERSDAENHLFRMLFRSRDTADGTGYRYSDLCRKAAGIRPGVREYYHKNSGNPYYFRILAAAVGLFGGVSLAGAMLTDTLGKTVLAVLFAILGTCASWQIHTAATGFHLRKRGRLYLAVGISALWLLLSFWAGEPGVAVYVLLVQWLAGFAVAYGGRRTHLGSQLQLEILGLRRYLKTVSRHELQRLCENHPEYFYDLAPYALAMGVDKPFARRFGRMLLPECHYLTDGTKGPMTASEWAQLLRIVAQAMDAVQTRQRIDRLRGRK